MTINHILGIIISAVCLIPMFLFGIILSTGRGAFLLAGYNTMTKEQQAKWNTNRLCRFMGIAILLFTFLLAVALIGAFNNLYWLLAGAGTLAVVELLSAGVLVNKSNFFKTK